MRDTKASGWMVRNSSKRRRAPCGSPWSRLGIGLVMTAGAARAQDDDEDDKTFEEKIVESIMTGLGGTNMDTRASTIASGPRWWCRPGSICRRRRPSRAR